MYRTANVNDAHVLALVEHAFCVPRSIPPEVEEGAAWFLENGGTISLVEESGSIHGAFWVIGVGSLRAADVGVLPARSPIRGVVSCEAMGWVQSEDLLVYSWAALGNRAKWLYRLMKHRLDSIGKRAVGFVSCSDSRALRNYCRMGCRVVCEVGDLYGDMNSHFLLSYEPVRSESRLCGGSAQLLTVGGAGLAESVCSCRLCCSA